MSERRDDGRLGREQGAGSPAGRQLETGPDTPRRVEGRAKVTGGVSYAGDLNAGSLGYPPGRPLDVAVAVTSAQASGQILGFDADEALAAPGVRAVVTHENAPRLHPLFSPDGSEIGELLPLQDAQIHYAGQVIALVVADTFEHARDAAPLLRVRYSAPSSELAVTLDQADGRVRPLEKVGLGAPGRVSVGDAQAAFDQAASDQAAQTVDLTVSSAPHHHNALEPGAIVAAWEPGDDGRERLTVHLPTQFAYGDGVVLAQAFGLVEEGALPPAAKAPLRGLGFSAGRLRVVSTLLGGAFGGKKGNIHLLLAPLAARVTGRPLRLTLTREQTFSLMSFRAESRQRVQLGADAAGHLQALIHQATTAQGAAGQYTEPLGETTVKAYACPNILMQMSSARLNTNAPGWMRGPGAGLGQFALETAMDALAYRLGQDPLQLRRLNHADTEPDTGKPWSSKSLLACYDAGARAIGWDARDPRPGSMWEGRLRVGYGMATSMYPTRQLPATARVTLDIHGRASVQIAAAEMGQGMLTALAQLAAGELGLRPEAVQVELGDTALPYAPVTAGSMGSLSSGTVVRQAARAVRDELFTRICRSGSGPLSSVAPEAMWLEDGRVSGPGGAGESLEQAMGRLGAPVSRDAASETPGGEPEYGRMAFGAQFARVLVDSLSGEVRVERLVGAFAAGRIINPLLARHQLVGGMIWGLGQALMEGSWHDGASGRWINPNLAEALVPVNADVRGVEALLIEEDDSRGSSLGSKGIGEVGVVGTPAAIASAVFHATGWRPTRLPIRLDDVLVGMEG